jgi:hypothetical protein
MNPATSRLAPDTTWWVASSMTASVIAAPGRTVANGAASARRLSMPTCHRLLNVNTMNATRNAQIVGSM